jgi:hypothetical protein
LRGGKSITERHIADIQQKVKELKRLERALSAIVTQCRGDEASDRPILDALAHRAHWASLPHNAKRLNFPLLIARPIIRAAAEAFFPGSIPMVTGAALVRHGVALFVLDSPQERPR